MDRQEYESFGEGRMDALAVGAEELTESLRALNENMTRLEGRDKTNRRIITVLAGFVVLKLVTIIVLIVVLVDLNGANHRIRDSLRQSYVTSQQQAQTRIKVLCPLYSVLLASIGSQPPSGNVGSALRKQYDASVKVIRDGYAALDCASSTPSAAPTG